MARGECRRATCSKGGRRPMTTERPTSALSGAAGLIGCLLLLAAGIAVIAHGIARDAPLIIVFVGLPLFLLSALAAAGLFTVQPNQAVVLILFGTYVGTVRQSGWWWTNPFNTKKRISLRVRSLNGQTIKVNDAMGNPVEIAAVVVWKVRDSAM